MYSYRLEKRPDALLISPLSVLENITFCSFRLQRELHLHNSAVIFIHVSANVTSAGIGHAVGPAAGPGGGAPGTAVAVNWGKSAYNGDWGKAFSGCRQEAMLLQLPEYGRKSGRDGWGPWSCTDAVWGRWIRHLSLYWQICCYFWRSINRLTGTFV